MSCFYVNYRDERLTVTRESSKMNDVQINKTRESILWQKNGGVRFEG